MVTIEILLKEERGQIGICGRHDDSLSTPLEQELNVLLAAVIKQCLKDFQKTNGNNASFLEGGEGSQVKTLVDEEFRRAENPEQQPRF